MSLPTDVHNRATDCADLPVLFAQAFNTGDLEAADELFERKRSVSCDPERWSRATAGVPRPGVF